jgi:hypothetical protein
MTTLAAASPDGMTWQPYGPEASVNSTLLGGVEGSAGAVLVGTSVAVTRDPTAGLQGLPVGLAFVEVAGSWRSASGAGLDGADLRGVISIDDGYLAFGGYTGARTGLGCSWGCVSGSGIWASADGLTWSAVLQQAAPPNEIVWFNEVVRVPGGLLASGHTESASSGRSTLLWTSPDGSSWTSATPHGLDGIGLDAVIATETGYLGATAFSEESGVFRSSDGVTWEAVSPDAPTLSGLLAIDDGIIGWQNQLMSPAYGVWTSPDGVTWNSADAYGAGDGFYAGSMASNGSTVVSASSNSDPVPVHVGELTVTPLP